MFWDKKKVFTIAILALLGIIAFFASISQSNTKVLDVDPLYFAVKDSLAIRNIVISDAYRKVELSAGTGSWLVNSTFRASEINISRLLYIVKNVKVKRELTGQTAKETIQKIKKEGRHIKVLGAEKTLADFIADNGDITSSSCFYDPQTQKAYFVELPSYTDDFSHFFNTDVNVWRSRLLCNNRMKSLQSVTSNFGGKIVKIEFKNDFFEIRNVNNLDSNTLGMYLIQYRDLECDQFLADSAQKLCTKDFSKAFAYVDVQDLDTTKNNKLYFYELPTNKRQFLGYSTRLKECFWMSKKKTFDLLIETEKLFEKQKEQN